MAKRFNTAAAPVSRRGGFMGEGYKAVGELDSQRTTDDGAMERTIDRMMGDYNKCRIASFDVPYTKAGRVYRRAVRKQNEKGTVEQWNEVYVAIDRLRASKRNKRG